MYNNQYLRLQIRLLSLTHKRLLCAGNRSTSQEDVQELAHLMTTLRLPGEA